MATTEVVGKLSDEDAGRLMLIEARREAVEANPHAFSQAETLEVMRDHLATVREMLERYNIDEGREWHISKYTGAITYLL